jgi:hypothetical protein
MASDFKKTASDHALAIIKAGLAAVPVWGGPLASLIADYIPFSTQRRIEDAVNMLTERLKSLEGRIDVDAVDREDFAELFKSCYLQIVRSHHEEKLKAATSLIANVLLKDEDADKLTYDELDHFARCLDALSTGAVRVLGALFDLAQKEPGNTRPGTANLFATDSILLQRSMPDIHPSLLDGLTAELRALHLVELPASWGGAPLGKYPIELTPLGFNFVKYLLQD